MSTTRFTHEQPGSEWHAGERAVQRMLGVPERGNPTIYGLKQAHAHRVAVSPLVAFGTLDERGRPWATVWGGEAGFCRPVTGVEDLLGVQSVVADARFDPVVGALFGTSGESDDGNIIVRPEEGEKGKGKVMAGLSIDLETRDRVKLAGHFVAGSATKTMPGVANVQMAFRVEEALGNCPKYLNKKHIVPHIPSPELVRSSSSSNGEDGNEESGLPLPKEAVELIKKADLFFIASKHGDDSMDMNHRGGSPGFVRVFRNEGPADDNKENNADRDHSESKDETESGVVLIYPEFSGNRLYQTLGNMSTDPVAGLAIPDFETGDVLYITGRTTILEREAAEKYIPRGAKLAVRIDVTEARFVRDGLPFRGSVIDYSPYNPPARPLAVERQEGSGFEIEETGNAIATATLLSRQVLTPTISRYVFRVKPTAEERGSEKGKGKNRLLKAWMPGQHVTFDFSPELDRGYSHMRDDDPQSLNDDFVRTFTVSSPLDVAALADDTVSALIPKGDEDDGHTQRYLREDAEADLEIIVRRHGPATALLANWDLRVPLEIPILGFGGVEDFRIPLLELPSAGIEKNVFVAAGVGITPLLAQAAGLLSATFSENQGEKRDQGVGIGQGSSLKVLWSLRYEDLPLAAYSFAAIPGLGHVTKLFVTGTVPDFESVEGDILDRLKESGAEAFQRRMTADDLLSLGEKGKRKFFCCTAPAMMKNILQWTEGENVVFENFEY